MECNEKEFIAYRYFVSPLFCQFRLFMRTSGNIVVNDLNNKCDKFIMTNYTQCFKQLTQLGKGS